MIDMHAHWRPAELADALRERTREPRIVRNGDGAEVLKTRVGEEPLSEAFDSVEAYLERMDRQGVSTSVLSLLGMCCWIESQPPEVSGAAVPARERQLVENLPEAPGPIHRARRAAAH